MRWVSWYDECHKYLWISIVSMDSGNPCMTCNKDNLSANSRDLAALATSYQCCTSRTQPIDLLPAVRLSRAVRLSVTKGEIWCSRLDFHHEP